MTNKCYYLSTCSTCKRILSQIKLPEETKLIDIKQANITAEDLDFAAKKLGTYETVFNKRAQKYKALITDKNTIEDYAYRSLILEEYTFLKRPLFILDDQVFAGNSPTEIERLQNHLNNR